jgi:hypothetical protein
MHWLSPFFNVEAKFGPLEKRIKISDIKRYEIFQKNIRVHQFGHRRNEVVLVEFKVEPVE